MSDQKELEQFNIESVYDEKISPLLNQIIAICNEHKMPMIASFAYEHSEEKGTCCCSTNLVFEGRHINQFARAVSVIRGESAFVAAFTITAGEKPV